MKDPDLPSPLNLGRPFDISDENLAAELRKSSGTKPMNYPVAELLARHWESVFAYARLCTTSAHAAGILATAAFTRMFGEAIRQTGPTVAWRPQLLVTVRRIAGQWGDDRRSPLLNPELWAGAGGWDRNTARLPPPQNRRLVFRAFHRLPEDARCLLWHTAVEAEALEIPAGLLGLNAEYARTELGRSRGLFHEGCLDAHLDLAPGEECRRYSRLLDVSVRRGSLDLDPDLRRHMAKCGHCRCAAEQLDTSGYRLAVLLAEGVLGWGARPYLDSRPGRRAAGTAADATPTGAGAATGTSAGTGTRTHRRAKGGPRAVVPLFHRRLVRFPLRRQFALAVLALTGCSLFGLALLAGPWSGDGDDTAVPDGSVTGAPGAASARAGDGTQPSGELRGRLRNVATRLCVDVRGGKATLDAETVTAACTSAATQQWSYEQNGLLRSLAGPALCLNSRQGFTIELGRCAAPAAMVPGDVRYDFTIQGNLIPRWNRRLAVLPVSRSAGAALVLKPRAATQFQQWLIDAPENAPRRKSIAAVEVRSLAPVAVALPPASAELAPAPSPAGTISAPRPTTALPTAPQPDPAFEPCYSCQPPDQPYPPYGGFGYPYGGFGVKP